MTKKHLVFFDGDCSLCNLAVQHLIAIDSHTRLAYFPLKEEFAHQILGNQYDTLIAANTLVLAENRETTYQIWIRSRAIFRIYWIIGGKWKILGLLSFLPGWLGDLFYRLIATFRHHIHYNR